MQLTVVQAKDLPAVDIGGTSDPYYKIHAGTGFKFTEDDVTSVKGKIIKKTLSPRWDEKWQLAIDPLNLKTIKIEIWDWDLIGKNTFICSVDLDMTIIFAGKELDGWFQLKDSKGKDSGQIYIKTSTQLNVTYSKGDSYIFPSLEMLFGAGRHGTDFDPVSATTIDDEDLSEFKMEAHAFGFYKDKTWKALETMAISPGNTIVYGVDPNEKFFKLVEVNHLGETTPKIIGLVAISTVKGESLAAIDKGFCYFGQKGSHSFDTLEFQQFPEKDDSGYSALFFGILYKLDAKWRLKMVAKSLNCKSIEDLPKMMVQHLEKDPTNFYHGE